MHIAVMAVGTLATFESQGGVCRDLRLVLAAKAPTRVRARESEVMAVGRRLNDELIKKMSRVASEEARPVSEAR